MTAEPQQYGFEFYSSIEIIKLTKQVILFDSKNYFLKII